MVASPARTPTLVDTQGRRIALGSQLARGGEGTVYPVADKPELVAKVYHDAIAPDKAAKLAAMAQLSSERLRKFTAWPLDTLHERSGGPIRGILMPRVNDKEIHVLYGPKTRRAEFPEANLPFLLHTAANVARAFAVVHEHGHVIGDVNHGSVLVSKQGTVTLVDCDSFQIFFGQRHLLCTVGIATHTPPELQGKSFAGLIRTPNHDAFGLAVLIFQLLFLGRHPFSGTYLGNGESSLERAIGEYRFAYGDGAAGRLMRQPPGTPPLDVATPTVAGLFERAFSRLTGETSGRPTAREWVDTLTAAGKQLAVCARHSGHFYPRLLGSCPWCAIEAATGVVTFNVALIRPGLERVGADSPIAVSTFDLDAAWAAVLAVPDPGPPPQLPVPTALAVPSPAARAQQAEVQRLGRLVKSATTGGGVITAVMFVASGSLGPSIGIFTFLAAVGCFVAAYCAHRARRSNPARQAAMREKQSAEGRLRDLERRWLQEAGNTNFSEQRLELSRQKDRYRALEEIRKSKLQELAKNARQRQLERYLDRYRIAGASIPNIGPGRKATLQSYGIETAADITSAALLRVPGFGPSLSSNLMAWRAGLEARFMFDTARAIDPADLAVIEREIANQRALLEAGLLAGPERLRRTADQITAARSALQSIGDAAQRELAQAQTDLLIL